MQGCANKGGNHLEKACSHLVIKKLGPPISRQPAGYTIDIDIKYQHSLDVDTIKTLIRQDFESILETIR